MDINIPRVAAEQAVSLGKAVRITRKNRNDPFEEIAT
jgi:hypothetical protein